LASFQMPSLSLNSSSPSSYVFSTPTHYDE
jgi:hypothetical protein